MDHKYVQLYTSSDIWVKSDAKDVGRCGDNTEWSGG